MTYNVAEVWVQVTYSNLMTDNVMLVVKDYKYFNVWWCSLHRLTFFKAAMCDCWIPFRQTWSLWK